MKRLIFVLMVVPFLLQAQLSNDEQYLQRNMNKGNNKTMLKAVAYTQTSIDTTVWYEAVGFKTALLYTHVLDSVSIVIKVQTSPDETSLSVSATADSVVNVVDAGDAKISDVTSKVIGAYRFRFIIGPSGTKCGTTTPKYTVFMQRKSN